jgi:lysophospholipase L1-like esterase
MTIRSFFVFLLICTTGTLQSQDPSKFKKEVDSLVTLNKSLAKKNAIVFTGSSSIRLWKDLQTDFPNHNVLNLGFGGSEMADLLYFVDDLVIPFKPKQVFIYEGDNDISRGRTPEHILSTAESIVKKIRKSYPSTEIIFISPKPSIRRWSLKDKYEDFNKKLKDWTSTQQGIRYADVWTPMLDRDGTVLQDIFVNDNLHLNEKGYDIWASVLKGYLK